MIRRICATTLAIFFLSIFSLSAHATTFEELLAQIELLKQQVVELQSKLAAANAVIHASPAPAEQFCHTFSTNLRIGDQNDEVTNLYRALIEEKLFDKDEAFQDGRQVLNFDERLASAVSEFQEKYAAEILGPNKLKRGTGYVGPATRAKLNRLYSCANVAVSGGGGGGAVAIPSVTVLSPNGGETWQKGTTQTIKWQDNIPLPKCVFGSPCVAPRLNEYDLKLVPYYPPCTSAICPAYPYREPYTIAKGIGELSYSWVVGRVVATVSTPEGLTNDTAPDGSYTVQICQRTTAICDSSDSYFKIVSGSSTNGSPKIIGIPAVPTNIQPGQPVSFSWAATDPDNDDLSWSLSVEDGGGGGGSGGSCWAPRRQTGAGWTFTTSHAWARPGTYRVKVTVSDCIGGSDTNSVTVTVAAPSSGGGGGGGGGSTPVITGISAPTTLKVGETGTWVVKAYDPDGTSLNYSVVWGDEAGVASSGGAKTSTAAPFVQNSTFTHAYSSPGVYTPTFTVSDASGLSAKTSATVNVGNTAGPSITVLSPNGGEILNVGQIYTIRWNMAGFNASDKAQILLTDNRRLSDPTCTGSCLRGLEQIVGEAPNTGSFTWNVSIPPLVATYGTSATPVYRLQLIARQYPPTETSNIADDWSDMPFIITANVAAPVSVNVIAPNGETYLPGQTLLIQWTSSSSTLGTVELVPLNGAASRTVYGEGNSRELYLVGSSRFNYVLPTDGSLAPGPYHVRVSVFGTVNGAYYRVSGQTERPFTLGVSGGSGGGGGGGGPAVTTIKMQPGNDYYFKGPTTLQQLSDGGFATSTTPANRANELFYFVNNPPAVTDSGNETYYRWQGASWYKVGTGATVVDPSTQTSAYFIIRKNGTEASTFTVPAGITYFGATVMNGSPRPWNTPNHPPTTVNDSMERPIGSSMKVDQQKITGNDSDIDGDTLNIIAVGSPTEHGATVIFGEGIILYTPPANFNGSDSFTYTISDGQGGIATGTVLVKVRPAQTGSAQPSSSTLLPNGNRLLKFYGVPEFTYAIQASTDSVNWTNLGTSITAPNGIYEFEDITTASFPNRTYRAIQP